MDHSVLLSPSVKMQHRWPVNMTAEDKADYEDEATYLTYDSFLRRIGKASVTADSVIYRNGILYKESLVSPDQQTYYRYRHFLKKKFFSAKVSLPGNKKYLLVTDSWSAGHFHWFCDVLPKLLCVKEKAFEFVLLLQDTPYIKKIGLESLDMLGLKFEDIVWMNNKSFYKTRELFYISKIGKSGHMHPVLMKKLRDAFLPGLKKGNKRIYISRNKAAYRKVLNEQEFSGKLRDYGFENFVGEDFTLREQAEFFSSANTLVGLHGAGLANCIFMHQGSNVIELRKKEHGPTNVGYWHLADALDHSYYYYNGVPDSDKPLVGQGCSLTVPVSDFEQLILSKL